MLENQVSSSEVFRYPAILYLYFNLDMELIFWYVVYVCCKNKVMILDSCHKSGKTNFFKVKEKSGKK